MVTNPHLTDNLKDVNLGRNDSYSTPSSKLTYARQHAALSRYFTPLQWVKSLSHDRLLIKNLIPCPESAQ